VTGAGTPPSGRLLPSVAVAGSAVLWGLWWLPVRWLEQAGLPGAWGSLTVYSLATVLLLPMAWRRRRALASGGCMLLAIGLSFGAVLTLWNLAVLTGDVVRVVLLFYLAPIWATGLAWLVLGERPGPWRLVSIVLGLSGAATVLGLAGGLPLPRSAGDWLGLLCGLLFAISATLTRKAKVLDGLDTSFAAIASAAGIALVLALTLPGSPPTATDLGAALLGIGFLALAWLLPQTWLVLWGASRLDPARVAILLLMEVVAAAASASLLTDEPFGLREGLGCLLILSAGLVEGLAKPSKPLGV
jgi:drug/metabolite transporter (DMT)-like permease